MIGRPIEKHGVLSMELFAVMFNQLSLHVDLDLWWTVCKHNFHTFQSSDVAVGALLLIVALATVPFLLHFFVCAFLYREQNLKKKYDASWALVTGSSSGIGKALVERLLQQDLNVCMVALGDDVFKAALKELQEKYPSCEVRGIFADLSSPAFMPTLIEQTKDIVPQACPVRACRRRFVTACLR
jgi:FlaA1/EpsC-like NDP-sugar epimerase